jgi:GTP cyclohydrolase I
MSNIECPVIVKSAGLDTRLTPARADAFVSLDQPQKGIHMSRLFISLTEHFESEPISPFLLSKIASSFLKSHEDISLSAYVRVNLEFWSKRPSLLSDNKGWRSYPLSLWIAATGEQFKCGLSLTIRYSSTCPCSAALARQLIQNRFAEQFRPGQDLTREQILEWLGKEESMAGTPHGQRSEGRVTAILSELPNSLDFIEEIIDRLENAVQTPVQSVVKREDEQEFARLNATNLMFAEDAVRRLSQAIEGIPLFSGTLSEVAHLESLHPHDAVAKVATGEMAAFYKSPLGLILN